MREETIDGSYAPFGSDVKVALVKYDRHYLKAFSKNTYFENLSKDIVKEMTGDGTTYDFNFENIPLQSYRLMVYTEADYYFVPRFNIHYLLKGKTVKFEETVSFLTSQVRIRSIFFN